MGAVGRAASGGKGYSPRRLFVKSSLHSRVLRIEAHLKVAPHFSAASACARPSPTKSGESKLPSPQGRTHQSSYPITYSPDELTSVKKKSPISSTLKSYRPGNDQIWWTHGKKNGKKKGGR